MQYLCLVYFEEAAMEAMSDAEYADLARQCREGDGELIASGRMVTGSALDRVKRAVTVRIRDGKRSVVDGPFAETREQLGGFIAIEAETLNEAVEVAARSPFAKLGCVEVRPMRDAGHHG